MFVFAVQVERKPESYDVLNIDHWNFYVVGANKVREYGGQSVGIEWVKKNSTGMICHCDLAEAIRIAGQENPAVEQ